MENGTVLGSPQTNSPQLSQTPHQELEHIPFQLRTYDRPVRCMVIGSNIAGAATVLAVKHSAPIPRAMESDVSASHSE